MISLEYPSAPGETLLEDSVNDPPAYLAVSTDCRPPTEAIGGFTVTVDDPGSGYTSAPVVSPASGPGTFQSEIQSSVASVQVTSAGSGYTSNPSVSFVGGSRRRLATAVAIVRGGATSAIVSQQGDGYTSPPTVSAAEGSGLVATAVLGFGSYVSLTLESGGDGYTDTPTISFSGNPSLSAIAGARVRQFVASIEVTNGGSGYTSQPSVSVTGAGADVIAEAQISGGQVVAVNLISAGSGRLRQFGPFPEIVVTISGGGGAGATAVAQPFRPVTEVVLVRGGFGFTAEDTITISGGGGTGASVSGTINYRVVSVTVQAGGDGYRVNQPLVFSGGGGSGAAGRLSISGGVSEVQVTDAGLYRNRRRSDGTETAAWPTISFSGGGGGSGAAATPQFAPTGLHSVSGGGTYETPPELNVSGGGGSGAAVTGYVNWAQSHEVALPIDDGECSTGLRWGFCFETQSDDYPEVPCLGCGGVSAQTGSEPESPVKYGESIELDIRASFAKNGRAYGFTQGAVAREVGQSIVVESDEGVSVFARRVWDAYGSTGAEDEALFLKRLRNRVPPNTPWFVSQPSQPPSASMAYARPVCKQIEDKVGQPLWWLTGFTVTNPGSNLLTGPPPFNTIRLAPPSGLLGRLLPSDADPVFSFSPPTVADWLGPSFDVPPTFSATFAPGDVDGDYVLSDVSISSPGEGGLDGTWGMTPVLGTGHVSGVPGGFGYTSAGITVTIQDGAVQSAVVSNPGKYRGPAQLVSATLPPPAESIYEYDFFTGRALVELSGFQTTTTYSEPTVEASAPTVGTPATFSLELTEGQTPNGEPFWYVSALEIVSGGSGYLQPVGIDFDVTSQDGVESVPAAATASPPAKEEPTLSIDGGGEFSIQYAESGTEWQITAVSVVAGGSGYQYGQAASVQLGSDDFQVLPASLVIYTILAEPAITASASGGSGGVLSVTLQPSSPGWSVASVSVDSPGSGYTNGSQVVFAGGDQPGDGGAYAELQTDANGAITGVSVFWGGEFYDDTGVAQSVEVFSGGLFYKQRSSLETVTLTFGGRYYNREIVVTQEPLSAEITCNEAITPENGWEVLQAKPSPTALPNTEVGEEYEPAFLQASCWTGFSTFYNGARRVRICDVPTVGLRFSQ